MTEVERKSDAWITWLAVVIILSAMAAGVAVYRTNKATPQARAKAQEFVTRLQAAGFRAPKEAAVVRLFGEEGPPAGEHPWAALLKAEYFAQMGTAGPAGRPVILDPRFIAAERIFLSVYEPEKLPAFEQYVKALKLGRTIRGQ